MKVALTFRNLANDEGAREQIAHYEDALRQAGLDPVFVTPEQRRSLQGLDGLVLPGGGDIDPTRYHEANQGSKNINRVRDGLEIELLNQALEADLPVLAICRGLQVLNVADDGSLIQDLPAGAIQHRSDPGKAQKGRHPTAHPITVEAGTKLAGIIGPGAHDVNSRHHQAVKQKGKHLVVSARSDDGVIEGLERPDRTFVVGVQWHPEDRVLESESDRKLFEAFATAVRARVSQKQKKSAAHES